MAAKMLLGTSTAAPTLAGALPRSTLSTSHVVVGRHAPQRRLLDTRCHFVSPLLSLLQWGPGGAQQQQQADAQAQQPVLFSLEEEMDAFQDQGRLYSSLLQQAEEITFNCAPTTAEGGGGNLCVLEDAERMLQLCIQERPQHLQPRVLLLRNLMRQSRGRERDVPALAIQALQAADLPKSGAAMMRHLHALQIVTLGVKALHKLQEQGCAPHTVNSFLAAAQAAAPSFSADFEHQALRVHRQLMCCAAEQRLSMLQDRDGYMSSVDLSAVCGQHHVAAVANNREEEQDVMPEGPAWA